MASPAPFDTAVTAPPATTLALKEWGAVACALLDGRQTVLLRKGGIHEKAFTTAGAAGPFVLFPTVAHSHADRVRREHHDLLACGQAQIDDEADTFDVRVGLTIVGAVEVRRPEALPQIEDLHIWTAESVVTDRVQFRPKHPLQVLVVRAVALPATVPVKRTPAYAGCKSWVDIPHIWDGLVGTTIHPRQRLLRDLETVRRYVG